MKRMGTTSKALKEQLDFLHPLCYPLLRWILTSNRCHLQLIPKDKQIRQIPTTAQFLLLSSPVNKERRFQELKKKHGSFYAWHGSPIANWHSIIRGGLKNLSGSSKQLHGAVNGSGIYLAPNSGLSMGYAGAGSGWNKSKLGEHNLSCLALCEGMKKQITLVLDIQLTLLRHFIVNIDRFSDKLQ
jgi:poly [ADP-ribose] polymerase 6/8